jgi:hypothetical protein
MSSSQIGPPEDTFYPRWTKHVHTFFKGVMAWRFPFFHDILSMQSIIAHDILPNISNFHGQKKGSFVGYYRLLPVGVHHYLGVAALFMPPP